MNKPRIVRETIKSDADMRELLSGDLSKIRQGLDDLETSFGFLYDHLEIDHHLESGYDCQDWEIKLYGFRAETLDEEKKRLERNEKDRQKRLLQLEKDAKSIEKQRKDLEKRKADLEKQLAKMEVKS